MLNTVIKLQKDNAMRHIVILISLFFSLNVFANNQVTCEFKHSNIADDVFVSYRMETLLNDQKTSVDLGS